MPGLVIGAVGLRPKLLGPVEGGGGDRREGGGGGGGSEGRRWLVNATMTNVHMVNESEGYLELGRQNADNLGLTELLPSSLSSSPVVARLCPGCKAYVQRVSDWQPFAPVPCLHDVAAQILSVPVVSRIATDAR